MTRLVSEISSGAQFQRSAEQGTLADSQVRVFRILLNNPGELVDPQKECGITIGQQHPVNTNIYCVSWDVKFEGDSRTVMVATFNYQSTPSAQGDDNKDKPPDIRPANWTISTTLAESPASTWWKIAKDGSIEGDGKAVPATNPAGDLYDGVSRMDSISTITIEQYEALDPTKFCRYVGCVNKNQKVIGSLTCKPGTIMFRGVQAKPTVESWGNQIFRGWLVTFEFTHRANTVGGLIGHDDGVVYEEDIGWDIAVPQTGFNIINKGLPVAAGIEVGSLVLQHGSDGKIANWPDNPAFATGTADKKVRGMVLVHAYSDGGGASQMPCAQPIPLNDDGSPRAHTATPVVKVKRYRTNKTIDFDDVFKNLRLT